MSPPVSYGVRVEVGTPCAGPELPILHCRAWRVRAGEPPHHQPGRSVHILLSVPTMEMAMAMVAAMMTMVVMMMMMMMMMVVMMMMMMMMMMMIMTSTSSATMTMMDDDDDDDGNHDHVHDDDNDDDNNNGDGDDDDDDDDMAMITEGGEEEEEELSTTPRQTISRCQIHVITLFGIVDPASLSKSSGWHGLCVAGLRGPCSDLSRREAHSGNGRRAGGTLAGTTDTAQHSPHDIVFSFLSPLYGRTWPLMYNALPLRDESRATNCCFCGLRIYLMLPTVAILIISAGRTGEFLHRRDG